MPNLHIKNTTYKLQNCRKNDGVRKKETSCNNGLEINDIIQQSRKELLRKELKCNIKLRINRKVIENLTNALEITGNKSNTRKV